MDTGMFCSPPRREASSEGSGLRAWHHFSGGFEELAGVYLSLLGCMLCKADVFFEVTGWGIYTKKIL